MEVFLMLKRELEKNEKRALQLWQHEEVGNSFLKTKQKSIKLDKSANQN